ncbi:lipase 3-like [Cylas formicarius]|uniref:lipase 3-like n=1 Tax=Cylas formicarius TaxID=197179 RepID=UPI002958C0B0|nr:lipase 3-like [Cylas formicarius]
MKFFALSCLVAFTLLGSTSAKNSDIDNLIVKYGYAVEIHNVITRDGFTLILHRIPGGRKKSPTKNKKNPVLLMHGFYGSSMNWVVKGPEKDYAFMLADAGYDVWLGNSRGNQYSKKPTKSSANSHEDIDKFSYHEIGIYDVPDSVDKILNVTGHNKLIYLCWAQGFTSFLAMGYKRPTHYDKIAAAYVLSPVTNMYKIKSPFVALAKKIPWIIFPPLRLIEGADFSGVWKFCRLPILKYFCAELAHLFGYSYGQLDYALVPHAFTNFPVRISIRQWEHYLQGASSGKFRPYDYGEKKNWQVYNHSEPTSYDLSIVKTPISIYYGEDDWWVNNEILFSSVVSQLPNVVKTYLIPLPKFNHLDGLYGKNISILTNEVVKDISNYNNN